jgi:hypothetical protein
MQKLQHANKDVHHQIHVIVMQKQLENVDLQELLLKLNAETSPEQIVFKDVQCHHLQEQFHKSQLFQDHVIALQQHLLNVDQELLPNSLNAEMMNKQHVKEDVRHHLHQSTNVTVPLSL